MVVCGAHFDPSDFVPGKAVAILRSTAVPKVGLPPSQPSPSTVSSEIDQDKCLQRSVEHEVISLGMECVSMIFM